MTEQHCWECKEDISDEADAILYHVIREHFDTEEFQEFVDDIRVTERCRSCGKRFSSGVEPSPSGVFTAHTYCPDCRDDRALNRIMADRLDCRELVARAELM